MFARRHDAWTPARDSNFVLLEFKTTLSGGPAFPHPSATLPDFAGVNNPQTIRSGRARVRALFQMAHVHLSAPNLVIFHTASARRTERAWTDTECSLSVWADLHSNSSHVQSSYLFEVSVRDWIRLSATNRLTSHLANTSARLKEFSSD